VRAQNTRVVGEKARELPFYVRSRWCHTYVEEPCAWPWHTNCNLLASLVFHWAAGPRTEPHSVEDLWLFRVGPAEGPSVRPEFQTRTRAGVRVPLCPLRAWCWLIFNLSFTFKCLDCPLTNDSNRWSLGNYFYGPSRSCLDVIVLLQSTWVGVDCSGINPLRHMWIDTNVTICKYDIKDFFGTNIILVLSSAY
jgi:hypothetical protein